MLPLRPSLTPVPVRARLTLWLRRLNRRRLGAIASSVVVIVVVNGVVQRARSTIAELGTRQEVSVLARDLPAGGILTSEDLTTVSWPTGLIPQGEIARAIVGRMARVDLLAGEVVFESRLFPSDGLVSPGQRQITLPPPLAPPLLAAGDQVELVGLLPPDGPFSTAPVILALATVVAADETGISVVLPREQALIVVEYLVLGVIEVLVLP